MRVRQAAVADADRIGAINVASWRAAYTGLLAQETLAALDPKRLADEWLAAIEVPEGPKVRLWVVERGSSDGNLGDIVGYSRTGPSKDADAEPSLVAEVYGFYIEPGAWGTGAGRLLMEHVLSDLTDRGFGQATLWVVDGNRRARTFYERLGWKHEPGPTNLCFGAPEVRYRRNLG